MCDVLGSVGGGGGGGGRGVKIADRRKDYRNRKKYRNVHFNL